MTRIGSNADVEHLTVQGEHKAKRTTPQRFCMEKAWSWQTVLLWAAAIVLVNVLWLNVAGQSAPNEINAENQFQTYREVDISPVFGFSSPIPASF